MAQSVSERTKVRRRRATAAWKLRNRAFFSERSRIRMKVSRAVARGELVRGPCWCGEVETQAHHANGYDDAHALDVVWLCAPHHRAAHREARAA